MNQNIYKTMKSTGAGSLVLGILLIVMGLTFGILNIVNGARLLKGRTSSFFLLLSVNLQCLPQAVLQVLHPRHHSHFHEVMMQNCS